MRIERHGFFAEYFLTLHDLEQILKEIPEIYQIRVIINGEYYTLER